MKSYVSDCCGGLLTVAGRTTNYYTCRTCSKPCWVKIDHGQKPPAS